MGADVGGSELKRRARVLMADDMTGAGDSGVHFAAAGLRTALLPDGTAEALAEALAGHGMAALSTESRFLPPEGAAEAVRRTFRVCRAAGAEVVYKKMDSTLRGHPGAEIAALLEEGGFRAALVCPAMPKTGRAVRGGMLFLHGRPLGSAGGAEDPFNPVAGADVAAILAAGTALPAAALSLDAVRSGKGSAADGLAARMEARIAGGARLLVADAEEDGDLAALAAALRRVPGVLPAGAGGFAEAIAGAPVPYSGEAPRGRMLAVVGSLTEASRAQCDYAAAHGFRVLDIDAAAWSRDADAEIGRLCALAAPAVPGDAPLLLKNRVPPSGRIAVEDGIRAADMFADAARAVAVAAGCSVLYATGGSTAVAVLRRLGVRAVTLERECMPGVVLGSFAPAGTGLRWCISKSGGFGPPETIARLAERMQAQS